MPPAITLRDIAAAYGETEVLRDVAGRAEGHTDREARCALKRLVVRRVFRALCACFETTFERVAA